MQKIPLSFYRRRDVIAIARELIGKIVVTDFEEGLTSGRIVETEAYVALTDKASHSFGGKRSAKNEHMYGDAGTSYVYICYGMHQMLNVVTNDREVPDAILIRGIEPLQGLDIMLQRTGKTPGDKSVTRGPGNVAKALGVFKHHSGGSLLHPELYFADDGYELSPDLIGTSARIGVESAGADGLLPYRFYVKGNPFVSRSNR